MKGPKLGGGRLEKEIRTYDLWIGWQFLICGWIMRLCLLLRRAGMWINVFRSIFVKIFFM